MKEKAEQPTTYKTTFIVRLFFYFWVSMTIFIIYIHFEERRPLNAKIIFPLLFFLFLSSFMGFQYIRIEEDGFYYKIFPFLPPSKYLWADIEKVEVRSVGRGGRMFYFYFKNGIKPKPIAISTFNPNEIKEFINKVRQMAPKAKIPDIG